MNPVIVYLTQNIRATQAGERDKRIMLEKSLNLLFQNYNERFKHPVVIFHEGDFSKEEQKNIIQDRKEITFHAFNSSFLGPHVCHQS